MNDVQRRLFVRALAAATGTLLLGAALAGPVRRLALLGVGTELLAMHRLEEHLTDLGIDEPVRTGTAGGRLRLARENRLLQRQLDEKRRQLEAELARAAEVQARLLPAAPRRSARRSMRF